MVKNIKKIEILVFEVFFVKFVLFFKAFILELYITTVFTLVILLKMEDFVSKEIKKEKKKSKMQSC